MTVVPPDRLFSARLLAGAVLAAAAALLAATLGVVPAFPGLAAAAVAGTLLPGLALVRLGLAIRATVGVGLACRGAGMLGLGTLAGGLAVTALPALPGHARPTVVTGGLCVAAALCLLGLLLLPGVATSPALRLRRAFDGLSIGSSLSLLGWLLLPELGTTHALGYTAAAVAVGFLSSTTVTVLRATRHPPALRCGGGVALVVLGLTLLVVAMCAGAPARVLPVAAAPLIAGPVLTWSGARRTRLTPVAATPPGDGTAAGFPVLAVPVGACLVVLGHRLVTGGQLDRVALLLAGGLGAVLAAREVVAAADVRRYARRLAEQEARLRALVGGATDLILVLGDDLVVRWQSPTGARRFGLSDHEVIGRRFTDLVHPDDAAGVADRLRAVTGGQTSEADTPPLVEARILDGSGRYRETESTVSDLRDRPEVGALVLNLRDVGERRRLERAIARLTSTDQLTGLPNRRELVRAVNGRRRAGRRSGALVVVELLDLTAVNDEYGSRAGDAVLVEAALRLRTHAGAEDVVGRLSGGRFAAVTADGPIEAYALGLRLLTVLTEPYRLPDGTPCLRACAGLAELAAGEDADDVLRRAELALHRAESLGTNRIEWYDESLERALVRRTDLERFLPGAVGRGEFDLVYQPIVELRRSRPVGVEALLRWRHPVLGTVEPAELLPVAEKLRMGREIADWVLHTACRQVARWRRDGLDLRLSVNVSREQVEDEEFVPEVAAALSVHQTPPERLAVEVAEQEVGRDIGGLARAYGRLRALGVRTVLDDFHGDHTSLDRLRRLPLDLLKIPSPPAAESGRWLAAGVDVARRLGLEVVAEGVEDRIQLRRARAAGCGYGQGRFIAPPAPAERVEAYLDGFRTRSR